MDFVFSYTIIGPFLLSLHFYFVNWTPIVACAEQAYARWKQRFVSFILFYSFHPLFVFTLDNRFFLLLYGNVSSYMNIYAFILSTRKRWIKAVQTKDYQFSRSYTYSADKLFHPFFFCAHLNWLEFQAIESKEWRQQNTKYVFISSDSVCVCVFALLKWKRN